MLLYKKFENLFILQILTIYMNVDILIFQYVARGNVRYMFFFLIESSI